MRMQYFRKDFSIRGVLTLILALSIETTCGQDKPADFPHELPPGVELVNPKDFGLTDADLGKFLGNVKVLGGGQVGDTKTQILTVGFNGDEDLNFDDFEIPGLTDKKSKESSSSPVPDKDKEIANIAFEKFKEFFKDPSKNAKIYDEAAQRSLPTSYATPSPQSITNASPFPPLQSSQPQSYMGTSPPSYKKLENDRPVFKHTFKDHGPKFNNVLRQNTQSLQEHYPVTLTQPIISSTPRNPTTSNANRAVVSIQHHKPRPSTPPNYSNHIDTRGQQNHQSINEINSSPKDYTPIEHREIASNFITPPQSQPQLRFPTAELKQNNLFSSQGEFGTKLPIPEGSSTYRTISQQSFQQGHSSTPQYTNDNIGQNFQGPLIRKPYQTEHQQYVPRTQQSSSRPAANFQTFNLHTPQRHQIQQEKESSQSIGKIVRNQLTFNYPTENTPVYPSRAPPPAPSPSASVASPILQKFPSVGQSNSQDQRPVSHVYINHNSHNSPVQQTSFHPRFQPPTRFVNNFTPSANQHTTPGPHFDVTPSSPMILISTNENAIKDPERTARLRQQQRHREELRIREQQRQQEIRLQEEARQNEIQQQQYQEEQNRQPHAINFQPQSTSQNPQYQPGPPVPPPQQPQYQQNIPNPPLQHQPIHHQPNQHENNFQPNGPVQPQFQNQPQQHPVSQPPARQFQGQNPPPRPTQYSTIHKFPHPVPEFPSSQHNSFNFQAQAQQHQLHTLQPPPQQRYPNDNEQFQIPTYSTIFPQPQASNNYPQQLGPSGGSFPSRFPTRDNQYTYSTIRHKRGYRHRLSSLLRGLWRGGDRE